MSLLLLLRPNGPGGTTFFITPSGTVTPTGSLTNLAALAKAGSTASAGALARAGSKPLAGSETPAGAAAKLISKPGLAGSVAGSGSEVGQVNKGLAGTTTPSGSLASALAKAFAGSLTPAGALAKLVSKPFAGSVAISPGFATGTFVGEVAGTAFAVGGSFADIPITANVPFGSTLVLFGAADNVGVGGAATTIDIVDTASGAEPPFTTNVWTVVTPQAIADPGTTQQGVQGFLAYTVTEVPLVAGIDSIFILFTNNEGVVAVTVASFNGVTPILASSYAKQDNQTGQSVSVATGVAPTAAGQIVCALVAVEGPTSDTFTQDTDTTNGSWVGLTRNGFGSGDGGITVNSAYKIVTAAGAQTYDHATMLGTARDHCAAVLVLALKSNPNLFKQVNKGLAGSETPAGSLVSSLAKSLSGSVSPLGALAKLVAKSLSGSVTPTGALSTLKVAFLSVAGTVTSAGALARFVGKALAGTVTPSSGTSACDDFERPDGLLGAGWIDLFAGYTLINGKAVGPGGEQRAGEFPQDMFNEVEITFASYYAEIDLYIRADATGTFAGSIAGGWYSDSPTVGKYYLSADSYTEVTQDLPGETHTVRVEAIGATANLWVDGVLLITDAAGAANGSNIFIGDVSDPDGSSIEAWCGGGLGAGLTKLVLKGIAGSVASSGSETDLVNKGLAGSVTPTGTLEALKTALLSLSGSVSPAGALAKLISKNFAGTETPEGSLTTNTGGSINLSGSVSPAGAITKAVAKALSSTTTPTGALAKAISTSFAGSMAATGSIAKQVGKSIDGTISSSGVIVRSFAKGLVGLVSPTGAPAKFISKLLAGLLAPSGDLTLVNPDATFVIPGPFDLHFEICLEDPPCLTLPDQDHEVVVDWSWLIIE